jgi:glycosyltransferase involved in cell wall biosynthesis
VAVEFDDVCVIVPVYNEHRTISTTVSDLRQWFSHVVCIDDGSSDDSADLALAAGATVLRHPINLGQGAALQTGFDHALSAGARYVVTFDADGQHLVDDAARMVRHARETGVDVVLASRFRGTTQEMPRTRELVLRAGVHFTRWTSGLAVTDTHNGLRVLSDHALRTIRLQLPRMAYASELLNAIVPRGLSYCELPTTVLYTSYSRTKGQRNSNSLNILFDLAVSRLRSAR